MQWNNQQMSENGCNTWQRSCSRWIKHSSHICTDTISFYSICIFWFTIRYIHMSIVYGLDIYRMATMWILGTLQMLNSSGMQRWSEKKAPSLYFVDRIKNRMYFQYIFISVRKYFCGPDAQCVNKWTVSLHNYTCKWVKRRNFDWI